MGIKDFIRKLKKEDIVVDLGDLQKRGIYTPGEEIDLQVPRPSPTRGIIDLSENSESETSNEGSSALGFLSSLAGAASSNSSGEETTAIATSTFVSSTNKQKLRGILRDLKEKIDSTYNKVYKLTERLDLLEKKIERLERRAGM